MWVFKVIWPRPASAKKPKHSSPTTLQQLQSHAHKAFDQYQHYQKMREIHVQIVEKNKQYIASLKNQYYQGRADRFQITQAENMFELSEVASLQNLINLKLSEITLKYLSGDL